MQIQLIYFGVLKDLLGSQQEDLEIAEGSRVQDVLRFLQNRASNRQDGLWTSLAVAVNREYAAMDTVLSESDEVALLPPVSGGCEEFEFD